jgi:CrcB protein
MSALLLVGLGGILGANARFFLSLWAARRFGTAFPFGTFLVNVSGSVLIGFVLGMPGDRIDDDSPIRFLLVTGFLGAYTTYSTFTFETIALVRQGAMRAALRNALGCVACGVAGAAAGLLLAGVISGRIA